MHLPQQLCLMLLSSLLFITPLVWAFDLPINSTCFNPFANTGRIRTPQNDPCFIFAEGLEVSGSKVDFHYLESSLPSTTTDIYHPVNFKELVISTARQTLKYYSTVLGAKPMEIIFIYQPSQAEGPFWNTIWSNSSSTEDGCYVNTSPIRNLNNLRYSIAHSLYSCIHRGAGIYLPDPTESDTAPVWRLEGASVFFAGNLFPPSYVQQLYLYYDPKIPLPGSGYLFTGREYGTNHGAVFFAFLAISGWADRDIHEWATTKQGRAKTSIEEIERIAADPRIATLWRPFILSYISRNITYKSIIQANGFESKPLHRANNNAWIDQYLTGFGSYDVTVGALAFTARSVETVDVVPGDLLSVYFTTDDTYSGHLTVHWQRNNEGWAELPKSTLVEMPGPPSGTNNNSNNTYSFLALTTHFKYNSTQDIPVDMGHLRFRRSKIN